MASNIFFSNLEHLKKTPLKPVHFKKVFQHLLSQLKDEKEYLEYFEVLGKPQSLEVHFCDDVEMREFQNKFRRLDRTTDVLSFPAVESPENSDRGFLGSLVISLPSVERNAKRYKRTLEKELLEVFIHGVLHLFGFDHVRVSEKKKTRMRKTQKTLLKSLERIL